MRECGSREERGRYLRLGLLGPERRGALLDAVGEPGDGHNSTLRCSSQLLLVGRGSCHQSLGILHQALGRLQDDLPAKSQARVDNLFGLQRSSNASHNIAISHALKTSRRTCSSVQKEQRRIMRTEKHGSGAWSTASDTTHVSSALPHATKCLCKRCSGTGAASK